MSTEAQPLSPRARWVLRIALIVAWGTGVAGVATSGERLLRYRSPVPAKSTPTASASASASAGASASASASASAPASASASAVASAPAPAVSPSKSAFSISPAEQEALNEARLEAFERFKKTRIPLSAANLVLSIALVIGAARTIGRRPGGRGWLRQVCIATVIFAGTEYFVSREERNFLVDRITAIRAPHITQQGATPQQIEATARAGLRMSYLLSVLIQLGLYGGLAMALGRASVSAELAPPNEGRPSIPPSSGPPSSDGES